MPETRTEDSVDSEPRRLRPGQVHHASPARREGPKQNTSGAALEAYGSFIASLAPWSHFVTLTHRPPDDERSVAWHRVGVAHHRRMVREWFHDDVRRYDPDASWWSEMEFHLTGQPHEHGMLYVDALAPTLSMRQAWWDRSGFAKWLTIDHRGAISPAAYVSKYSQKSTSREPMVWGLGLGPDPAPQTIVQARPASVAEHERRFFVDPARVIEENER